MVCILKPMTVIDSVGAQYLPYLPNADDTAFFPFSTIPPYRLGDDPFVHLAKGGEKKVSMSEKRCNFVA